MSVDYRAALIAGWKLSFKEVEKIPDDVYEEVMDNDILHITNTWVDAVDTDYVLGHEILNIDIEDGVAIDLQNKLSLPQDKVLQLKEVWKKCFPDSPEPDIKCYFVGMVS